MPTDGGKKSKDETKNLSFQLCEPYHIVIKYWINKPFIYAFQIM